LAVLPVVDDLDARHRAVLRGDAAARDALCRQVVPDLRRRLSRAFPRVDPDVVETAVHDAVLKYLQKPDAYDPSRGSLLGWLFVAAHHAVIDLERRAAPRRRHEAQWGLDLAGLAGPADDPDAEQRKSDWLLWYRMELYSACRTDAERLFVAARLAGAGRDVQVRALGVGRVDPDAAERAVKLAWKRIKMREPDAATGTTRNAPITATTGSSKADLGSNGCVSPAGGAV
jgi:DNA-directed RNA polymerase specialized sigma24 family protein